MREETPATSGPRRTRGTRPHMEGRPGDEAPIGLDQTLRHTEGRAVPPLEYVWATPEAHDVRLGHEERAPTALVLGRWPDDGETVAVGALVGIRPPPRRRPCTAREDIADPS